jgi:hypothetical protein
MRLGNSICLIAFGAALTFAVHAPNDRIDIGVIGIIVRVVGIVSILLSPYDWNRPAIWASPVPVDPPLPGDAPAMEAPAMDARAMPEPPIAPERPAYASLRVVDRAAAPQQPQGARRAS